MKKNLNRWKASILMLFVVSVLYAQTQTITGTITDKSGEALIGVSVVVTGKSIGTVTRMDGTYSVDIPGMTSSLTFSYIGYQTKIINIQSSVINVVMEEDQQMLEELVVVGYGVQKRKDVTGAVISIKPDDLKNMPSPNIIQSLQGKLPGLNITSTANSLSDENNGMRFRVRGQRSISRDASPLIILDGVQYNGFMSEINPDDIESIDILKDASSAAIYGSKAANGVILITTKKGKQGKSIISFNATYGSSSAINKPQMMNGEEYHQLYEGRYGISSFNTQQYNKGVDTNWLDYTLQTGQSQDYNLSVSGAGDKTSYFISGNVSMNKGIAINDVYNRYSLRANVDTQIASWFKIGTSTTLTYGDRPGTSVNLDRAMRMSPLLNVYDEQGDLDYYPDGNDPLKVNPLEALNVKKEDVSRTTNTINYLQIDFPFLKGLSYKLIGGYNYRTRLIEIYKGQTNTGDGIKLKGVASVANQYKEDWSLENILSYNKTFGDHSLFLTAVYGANKSQTKYHNLTGNGFSEDTREYYQFAEAEKLTGSDTFMQRSSLGQMFRTNYSYLSRYMFTFTIRRDGDSAFGIDNKYGIFPSLALGWNMEEESFFKNQQWLDRSKLRWSWGKNGNQAISAYDALASMTSLSYLNNDGNTLSGFYSDKLAYSTLSWETTKQWNIGWDYSFLKGRVSGSIDAYSAQTYDLLLNKTIPQMNGVKTILQNIGKTQTNGVEFQLSTVNLKTKNFRWETNFNISHDKDKILDVGLYDASGNPTDNLGSRWFIGNPINVIYGYEFDGIWQEGDDIAHSHTPSAKPGEVRALDYNSDGVIDANDRHILGRSSPDFRAGLMNTLIYKNLTLSFFFNAVHGITRYTEYNSTFFQYDNIRQRTWWTPENPINTNAANRSDSNPYSISYFGKSNDASYIRWQDLSMSYRFPRKLVKSAGISDLEIFGNVKNLLTITNYVGMDPELSSDYTIPSMRSFLMGIRVKL